MEEESNIEYLSNYFNIIYKEWERIDLAEVTGDKEISKTLAKIDDLINKVKKADLFSADEAFNEINADHLCFNLLPFLKADIIGHLSANRKENLEKSKTSFFDYLKLLKYYQILSEQQCKDLKNISESIKANVSPDQARTQKIEKFKATKEFKNLVEKYKHYSDEKEKKMHFVNLIKLSAYKSFDAIDMIEKELSIIALKPAYEEAIKNPETKKENPFPLEPKNLLLDKRILIQKQVFQPGFPQPSMSMEMDAELNYQEMLKNQEKFDEMERKEKAEKEKDPDRDEVNEAQVKKDREWDDWKDMHEKGAGNKKGKL